MHGTQSGSSDPSKKYLKDLLYVVLNQFHDSRLNQGVGNLQCIITFSADILYVG